MFHFLITFIFAWHWRGLGTLTAEGGIQMVESFIPMGSCLVIRHMKPNFDL